MCIEKSKRLYCKSLKQCCSPSDLTTYQTYSKCLKKAIRTAKKLYHCNKCDEYRNNTRIDGIKEYGAKRISNSLAKYFSGVGRQFAEKILSPKHSIDLYLKKLQSNHKSLYFDPCDVTEVKNLINMLPKKTAMVMIT